MSPNPQKTADLVTFTGEILNGKLHFLCSASMQWNSLEQLPPTFSEPERHFQILY